MHSLVMESVSEYRVYTKEDLSSIDFARVPHHVAIIMDGNRRWARLRGLPPLLGHWRGAEALTQVVRAASELGIRVMTVYAFSTENWARPSEEVHYLMELFKTYLERQRKQMIQEGVRLGVIGDIQALPADVQEVLEESKKATAGGEKIDLVLAMNYGGRDDIRRAVISIVQDVEKGKLSKEEISEEVIAKHLDTSRWQDPEILIRTSGEMRQSNFLLWQLSYSEFYRTSVLWPDFDGKELLKAISEYQQRERRFGGG